MAFGGWGIVFMTVLSIDYLCAIYAIYVLSMCYLYAIYVLNMCFLCAVYVLSAEYLKSTYQVGTCFLENIERECLKNSDRTKQYI